MKDTTLPTSNVKTQRNGKILVLDDDPEMRSMLEDFLKLENYEIFSFEKSPVAFDALMHGLEVDLIISDIKMPDMDGIEFCSQVHTRIPDIPIILATAFASVETAIEGMKKGAYDYIIKPFKLTELSILIERAIQFKNLKSSNLILREEIQSQWKLGNIIGKSPSMKSVFDLVERVSSATANVLIIGESGTGKEVVAQAIHELGPRKAKPFVAINCTAIPENLLESELFGHAKGSFTGAANRKRGLFEEADGGTIFLDEIGDMNLSLQSKLLRVLQEKKIRSVGDNITRDIDVRVIAATHKDLKKMIRDGLFREDLYYRLSVIPIVIPPLRHRKEDIPILANYFLKKYSSINNSVTRSFSVGALERLMNMPWHGNVRELENLIERIVVLHHKPVLDLIDIPVNEDSQYEQFYGQSTEDLPPLDELEKRYMRFVLDKTGGRKEKAAQILGINRKTLYRKEREYGFVEDTHSNQNSSDENSEDQLPSSYWS